MPLRVFFTDHDRLCILAVRRRRSLSGCTTSSTVSDAIANFLQH